MAFKASGRDLWVGSGERYTRLKDAVAAARDGDTIHLKEGTYVNDFATITKSVRIVGEGDGAHLKNTKSHIDNGKAILIVRDDVVIDNLEFSGAKVADGNGAGIRFEAGSLSIENSDFHHNQNGILTAHPSDGRVTIVNSEFAHNGNNDGQTHGIYIGRIAELVVKDSYFHDTDEGHHIKSRARDNTIVDNRLIDGKGDASYNIDLPDGNDAVIRGNVIEQSAVSANRAMIHYGGEASSYTGHVLIENNEFINHRDYNVAVFNQTPVAIRIEDNVFHNVDNVAYGPTSQRGNVIYDDLSHVGEGDTGPGPGPAPEPDPEPDPGASVTDLLVRASGDDYMGDPQFQVYVDGEQLGTTTAVAADRAEGEWQTFSFGAEVGADGLQRVEIRFVNDSWAGPDKDRNLYIDYLEIDGTRVPVEDAVYVRSNGRTMEGREKMSWTGTMVFDADDVELLGAAPHTVEDGGLL